MKERQHKIKDEHFKNQAKKIDEREQRLKREEARIQNLRRKLPDGGIPGAEMDAAIIPQQKQLLKKCLSQNEKTETLLARQLKLEEEMQKRETTRKRKASNRKRF